MLEQQCRAEALTLKQERFVKEYLIDLNATAAAHRAGYKGRYLNRTAWQLLRETRQARLEAMDARLMRVNGLMPRQDWANGTRCGLGMVPPLVGCKCLFPRCNRLDLRLSRFPPGVHLIGGRNAAATYRANADEFYRDIIPVVLALAEQGLSLRAIARELDRRGIKTRRKYPGQRWSAMQVKRILLRARSAANCSAEKGQAAVAL